MSFDDRLRHTLVIERSDTSSVDEWNTPVLTWSALATVPGLVQPKTAREVEQLNDAGTELATHRVYLRPTALEASDRIRVASGPMAGLYEIIGIRDAAGLGHHYEVDARTATLGNQEPTAQTTSLTLTTFAPTVT